MPREHLKDKERLAWLRLWRSEQIGPATFRRLLQSFGSATAALERLPDLSRRGRGRPLTAYPAEAAATEIERLAQLGGRFIASCEPDYPIALTAIADAPPVIAALGNASLLRQRAIAIVGARNASANGRFLAEAIARQLGELGWAIVSGLARGIDAAAHQGALASGTIAVLAGGIDKPYPPETEALYREIAQRGLLLAESPLGYAPQARDFPRRNRIVSGIADGVVVIEAAVRSGSLITARLAGEQGREVMAVPGSPLDPRCRGANQLIREGALLVESAADIDEAVRGLAGDARPGYDQGGGELGDELDDDLGPTELADIPEESLVSVVERYLSLTPVAVDELLRQCQLSAPFLRMTLLELELAGRLQWHPGNRVSLLATG
jgi:DNA processing protein